MKNNFPKSGLIKSLFFVLILFTTFTQAQDWIKEYPGIPLEAGLDWDWITKTDGSTGNRGAVDSMKLAGIDIVRLKLANLGKMDTITTWESSGFRALPFRSADIIGNVYNWIQHYTDAKYSVWEAEGSSLGTDDAGLVQKHPSITETYNYQDATFVRRLGNIPNAIDTLTEGPYYVQDVHYYASQGDDCNKVEYKATFSLMLQNNNPAPPYNPTDTVCVLQVTYSKNDSPFHLDTTIIIEERIVRRIEFENLNVIDTVSIDYDLASTISLDSPEYIPGPQNNFKADLNCPGLRDDRKYIQFKVIWKGKSNPSGMPQYLLSFDKVIVSDLRGRELVDPSSEARSNIEIQDQKLIDFETDITGWMGIDEPVSIDIFEPIRIVKEILSTKTSNKRPLRIPFMGSWSGYWDRSDNIFGAMGKSKWKVFALRVGDANIIQNFYLYEYPYRNNGAPCNCSDYRVENIYAMAELNYKQAYQLDPNFGVSIQCGANNNDQSYQRNIKRHELLYNINMALMYGAKFIELWPYFAQRNVSDSTTGFTFHGIVDWEPDIHHTIYTDKYFTLRDTISPRLKGLFGKTLKSLIPSSQFAGSNGISYSNISWDYNPNGYEYIEDIIPSDSTYSLDEYGLEMGFFNDSLSSDKKYFMVLNRYYSSKSNYSIKLKDLDDYYNWNLINYVDTTSTTLLTANNKTTFLDTLLKGDANLYSIAPVVKYGGLLAYNDTIKTNTTLSDNMTIDAGKVLQINEGKTYTITDTITFTDTSSFITGYGYVNRTQSGWITTRSWNRSLFKGRSGSHPKLIWSKHPDITNVIDYKIYRNHSNGGWQYLTTKSSSIFEYIDSTITIIEGMSQANETSTQYRITATHRPTKDLVETSPTNTILYHRVEGQGLEKQNSGSTSNDFKYNLDQNYPNPFNPNTTISYSIAEDGIVTLEILNILGERIKTLVNDFKTRGNHNISFNASSFASGVYVYKLQVGDFVSSRKMILLK